MNTKNPKAALLRLLAAAKDQQTCDDLALVVHALEQAKMALRDAVDIANGAMGDDDEFGAEIANAEGVLAMLEAEA